MAMQRNESFSRNSLYVVIKMLDHNTIQLKIHNMRKQCHLKGRIAQHFHDIPCLAIQESTQNIPNISTVQY